MKKIILLCLVLLSCFLSACAPHALQGAFKGKLTLLPDKGELQSAEPYSEDHTFTFYADGYGTDTNEETGYTAQFSYTASGGKISIDFLDFPDRTKEYTYSFEDDHLVLKDTSNGMSGAFKKTGD